MFSGIGIAAEKESSVASGVKRDNGVLILNGNSLLRKYSIARDAFNDSMGVKCEEIDLRSNWLSNDEVEKFISDKKHKILYCIGSKAFRVANEFGKNRPIIFSLAINWQRFKPGKNTYGVSNELGAEMQLMMFRYIFPKVKNLGIIYSKEYSKEWVMSAKDVGYDMGFNIKTQSIKNAKDLISSLDKLLQNVDALWLIPDPVILSSRGAVEKIFEFSDKLKKPVFAYNELFIRQGAVLTISPDIPTIGRQAASLAKELLHDREIKENVLELAGSSIVLNLKQIRKYETNVNLDALDSVNKVIK